VIFFIEKGIMTWQGMALTPFRGVLAAVIGYLLGSISFAIIIAKHFEKMDIREYGSGNAGASNITRTVGLKAGAMTAIGDILKGFVAGVIGWALGGPVGAILGGGAAFVGHCFPVYFGFRGGKGVATAGGAVFTVDWRVAIFFLCCWLVICLTFRMMGLGAALGGWSYPLGAYIWHRGWTVFMVYCVFVALFLVYNHRSNISRMLRGTEPKATFKTHKKEEKYG